MPEIKRIGYDQMAFGTGSKMAFVIGVASPPNLYKEYVEIM